jgi:steroid 5-alpha reductase family enzyme
MDIAYPGLVVAVAAYALTQSASGLSPHALALFALPAIWGARLMSHATGTNLKVEQEPYANLRRRYGKRWTIWSFFAVYALQGSILWLWCAPIIVGMSVQSAAFTLRDALGVAVWLTGFAFQSIGDHQLKMFKRDPANKGKLMQSGLWSRTRHPNYFGECLMWTGYVFFALTYPWGWTTILSAIYVTWFMGWGSAAPGNERHMRKTRPEYEAYAKRVPRLFPRLWPNKEQRA